MTKSELIAALASLPDHCDVLIEKADGIMEGIEHVSVYEDDGPDEPQFATISWEPIQ